jgi:hypothetical protein
LPTSLGLSCLVCLVSTVISSIIFSMGT